MKHLTAFISIVVIWLFLLFITALDTPAASPSYTNFDTNHFTTNTVVGGQIRIRVNTNTISTMDSNGVMVISNAFIIQYYQTLQSNVFTTNIFVSSNAYVSNIFVSNNIAVSSNLFVSNNVFVDNDIQINNNLYVSNNIFVGGQIVSPSWINQRTYYVAPWLNNSNGVYGNANRPYALSNAVALATNGDFIVMFPGLGRETNQLRLNRGVTLIGMGSQTIIEWWNGGVTNGVPTVLINPADNCFIGYFTVSNKNPSHASVIGGNRVLQGDQSFTNVTVVNLFGYGNTDAFFLRDTNVCQMDIYGGAYVSQWDAFVSGHALHRIRMFGSYIEANGAGYRNGTPTPVGQAARAVQVLGGAVELYNCTIKGSGSTNSAAENQALATTNDAGFVAGSSIKAYNCALTATNPVTVVANTTIELLGGTTTNNVFITSTNAVFLTLSPNMAVGTDANRALISITGGSGEVLVYTNASPVADSVLPSNQSGGAIAYRQNGNGSVFIWDNATLSWK